MTAGPGIVALRAAFADHAMIDDAIALVSEAWLGRPGRSPRKPTASIPALPLLARLLSGLLPQAT
ncbi:hypothetical protein [Lichenicoccus sp.]|uniref:hypothetical protein n=1 Tax=Lichenicoccus sp. TaxID=2781899 RepID=UPI003D0AB78D